MKTPIPAIMSASLNTTTAISVRRPPIARMTAKSFVLPRTLVYIVREMMTTPIKTAMEVENPKLPPIPVLEK